MIPPDPRAETEPGLSGSERAHLDYLDRLQEVPFQATAFRELSIEQKRMNLQEALAALR